MTLAGKISVSTHYTRSINVERDQSQIDVVKSYVPTSRALRTLQRIVDAFSDEQHPRAWSLIGPYGSGKSAFGIYVRGLLAASGSELGRAARDSLKDVSPSLAHAFEQQAQETEGYLPVMVSGSPEPLSTRLVAAMASAAYLRWGEKPGPKPAVLSKLEEASRQSSIPASVVIDLLDELVSKLENQKGVIRGGVVLVIDELGKFLEYEAHNYGANDIYILQALAEYACDSGPSKVFVFALLHQSFEQYAKGLGESLKAEWAKIQGRFEEIPFIESSEQVLRVVSHALIQNLSKQDEKTVKEKVSSATRKLLKAKAIPGELKEAEAVDLFTKCYPLHPLAALLLPVLCQKVAQNERTLFSYLGSQEEFGFQDKLSSLESVGEWIYPVDIYEYFVANQPAVLSDQLTHRRWAEVLTVVERLNDVTPQDMHLLKTIGLLNIIGARGGLKASKAVLESAFSSHELNKSIGCLKDFSAVTYRKFNSEYRVWQGSDFDLEEAIHSQVSELGNFSLSEELNGSDQVLPVVARAYSIKTGALRYFQPVFIDASTFKKVPIEDVNPRILFYLVFGQDDIEFFKREVSGYFSASDIVALCLNGPRIREAVQEVLALRAVESTRQELANDPVAQREFRDRLTGALASRDSFLRNLMQEPKQNQWHWKGRRLQVEDKRALQKQLSIVLENVFSKSAGLHNELINRDKPSSQATAGRNKLLYAMLANPEKADLAIEKFPPEKAIYRSILRETGLHVPSRDSVNSWMFEEPKKGSELFEVWRELKRFLEATEAAPKSFTELTDVLTRPPYGVKKGVLPILYAASLLIYKNEVALYENRRFVAHLTDEILERFSKVPEEFSVQRFKIEGLRRSVYEQYQEALFSDDKDRSVLELVRPLASFIGNLPDYTKKTKSADLSLRAKELRAAFNLSKSPQLLIFEDVPRALGFEPDSSAENIRGMAAALQDALRELKYAFPNMVEHQRKLIAQAFHLDPNTPLPALRTALAGRYRGLESYTVDVDGMRAFLKRLCKDSGGDEHWLSNILMFLGQKPAEKWGDADRAEAEVKLADFSKRILDLEALRLHHDKVAGKYDTDFDVYLLRSLKKGGEPIDEVVAIGEQERDSIRVVKESVMEALAGDGGTLNQESQLAVLAELVDEFLTQYRALARKKQTIRPARRQDGQA
ncbi:hypothetical protein ACLD0W_02735 [Alloalcanivorax sp. C16-1]|uniref:hypothetical protein n=1 Tax=Alloalcanivorax sp. C16-1 TaxID=3390051 RepID=UPI00397102EE